MPFDYTIYDNEHPLLSAQGIENLVTYVYPYRIDLVSRFTNAEEKIWDLLSTLRPQQRYFLVELNGLFTGQKLTLRTVGNMVGGLSKERVRQVCSEAGAKLRHPKFGETTSYPVPPPSEMSLRAWGKWPGDHLSWSNQVDYAQMFSTQGVDTFGDLAKLSVGEIHEMFASWGSSEKNAVLFLQALQALQLELQ